MMSNVLFIVIIGTFIGMIWMIRKAESCVGVVINAALFIIAGIAIIMLISLMSKSLGL